ncbi:MAG: 50S ribosomal protein L5 [Petrimonas sp.]|jgi:large subunit ribosomal protein L5
MAKEEKKEKAPAKPVKEKATKKAAEPKVEAKKEVKVAAPQKEDKGNNVNTVALKKEYTDRIVPALMKEFSYKSVMQAPKLEKIVINQGLGIGVADKKIIETAINELTAITGQKAVATHSRKDISNFKLRKKMAIGARVTLRHDKMYEFLERLIRVALPRIRDFRGIEGKLDGRGNYTMGIQEQIIFPEINIDSITRLLGMNITFVTSAATDEEGYALLREFGLPFKTEKNK